VQQEFALHDSDFRTIAGMVKQRTGIVINETKRAFVHGRLGRRLRVLGLADFSDYCRLLKSPAGETECDALVTAITTNHTNFLREPHHFEYSSQTVLPAIVDRGGEGDRRLRIWSAGCSSGEEPYTLAITLCDFGARLNGWDAKILATDLDTNMVAHAAAGIYEANRMDPVPVPIRKRYFAAQPDGRVRIEPGPRALITFKQLNLLEHWPMAGPFDVIFCRNVVIYFDKPTQRRLFDRYADLLKPDGWLFVGHSESLNNVSDRFKLVGRTIYRRVQ